MSYSFQQTADINGTSYHNIYDHKECSDPVHYHTSPFYWHIGAAGFYREDSAVATCNLVKEWFERHVEKGAYLNGTTTKTSSWQPIQQH